MNTFYTVVKKNNEWIIKENVYDVRDDPICICPMVKNAKLIVIFPELFSLYKKLDEYFYSQTKKSLSLNFDDIQKDVLKIKKKLLKLNKMI